LKTTEGHGKFGKDVEKRIGFEKTKIKKEYSS